MNIAWSWMLHLGADGNAAGLNSATPLASCPAEPGGASPRTTATLSFFLLLSWITGFNDLCHGFRCKQGPSCLFVVFIKMSES